MAPKENVCARCDKPTAFCVCDRIVPLDTRVEVLLLQHPREHDEVLASAPLVRLSLPRSSVHVGLSWRSLEGALGREVDPQRWAVLYPGSLPATLTDAQRAKPALLVDRHGHERALGAGVLDGVVLLDGTWSQAKTLWWRNAWLLRLARLVLHPEEPSAYGRLRAQSKRENVSTLEAVALALDALGEPASTGQQLRRVFRTMLQRARDAQTTGIPGAPKAPAKRPNRRRAGPLF